MLQRLMTAIGIDKLLGSLHLGELNWRMTLPSFKQKISDDGLYGSVLHALLAHTLRPSKRDQC